MKEDSKRTINSLYTIGYLLTLLMGSLHFGISFFIIIGFDITIFGITQPLFMKMYGWEDEEKYSNERSNYNPYQ